MKVFILALFILLFVSFVGCVKSKEELMFKAFQKKFNKVYSPNEKIYRFSVFKDNLNKIHQHNQNPNNKFQLGINQFTDLTNKEYQELYLMNELPKRKQIGKEYEYDPNLPTDDCVDWKDKGVVPNVIDQGQCGSCWAISAMEVIESCLAIDNGSLVKLSIQEIIDCDDGSYGCNGGWPKQALKWEQEQGGSCSAEDYPYTGMTERCKSNSCKPIKFSIECFQVLTGNETEMAQICAQYGPLSAAIDASHFSFQTYVSGIYYEKDCSSTNLDHAVLVVGYCNSGDDKYWIVQNSWGSSWGMQGYIWMSRDKNNNCGIATDAWYCKDCHFDSN
ncbi:cysteine protease rdl2-related [Anaeramoeba ignava]|uniref:Cysteine protease rdl2-related n=1 Tax=Anaeramoeba ignava TaxID=1746090 RepID=A0A9Q0LVM3_ANAIG|nr:cysteine protease rdl2-related [Anaeramoeba ignava]